MNYKTYKLKKTMKKVLSNLVYKIEDIVWYIPRKIYAENETFRNYMKKRMEKSDKKRYLKRAAKEIFGKFEKRKELIIIDGTVLDSYYMNFEYTHYVSVKYAVENKKWIKKNGFNFYRMAKEDFIKEFLLEEGDNEASIARYNNSLKLVNAIYILEK